MFKIEFTKKYIIIMITGLFLLFGAVYANAASMMNFSGKITENSGSELADGVYDMKFKIYDAQTGGNVLWSEDLTAANRFGGVIDSVSGRVYTYDGEHGTTTLRVGQYVYNSTTDEAVLIVDFDQGLKTITVASGSPMWSVGQAINNRPFVEGGIINENLGTVSDINVDFSQTRYLELEFNGEIMEPRKILNTVANSFNAENLGGQSASNYANINNDLDIFGQWSFDNVLNVATNSEATALTVSQDGMGDIVNFKRGSTTAFAISSDGQVRFENYSFPISDGQDGYVLKTNGSGVLSWQLDSVSVFGSGWASSSDSKILYPADTSQIVVIGSSSTSTSGYRFEVRNGDSLFEGLRVNNNLFIGGTITNGAWNGAQITNAYIASSSIWNTAYLWGNHNTAGYLTNINSLSIADLADVSTSSVITGNILRWDGSAWVNYADSNYATFGHNHSGVYQTINVSLSSIAGLNTLADQMLFTTGANNYATTTLTAYARTILDDADAVSMRNTLGLGSMATLNNTGSTTVTILGTIATGAWQGDVVAALYGGTGVNTIQSGYLLMGNNSGGYDLVSSTTLGSIPALTDLIDTNISGVQNGHLIRWDSVSGKWINVATNTLAINLADTTGTLGVNRGGTGKITWTQGGILFATTTSELSQIENGLNGYALIWDNVLGRPIWASTTVATAHALLSAQHSDADLGAVVARGAMIIRNATNDQWTTLTAGNQYQFLTIDGNGDPIWATTTNITELGTIANGVWQGSPINSIYIASSTEWGTAYTIVMSSSTNWNAVYDIVNASSTYWDSAYSIINNKQSNWDTAFGWGNHAAQSYFATTSGPLDVAYGGTGKSAWIAGGLLWASSTGEIGQIATGTNGYALTWGTDGPTWSSTTAATVHELFSGVHSDTNISGSLVAGDLMFRNTSNQWENIAIGSIGNILWVNGSNLPEWTATSSLGFATTGHDHNSVYLQLANNLSDLSSSSTARTNLGLNIAYTNQSYMINSAGNIDEVWMGGGSGWKATGTLGLLSLNAIDMGTAGYIPYYASASRQLTATSTIYIDDNTNVGIGTTSAMTKKLSVAGGAEFDQICIGNSCITNWSSAGTIDGSGSANAVAYWSDANTLTYEAQLSVTRGGTGRSSYSPGSILFASTTTEIGEIATSSDGWALIMQNGIPTWASTSPGTTHTLLGNAQHSDVSGEVAQDGDLLVRTGGNWGRLAKGNQNQYLIINGSGQPEWATTTNITELGTITAGIWNGSQITNAYIASSSVWNTVADLVNASSSNWTTAYDAITASSTYWDSAYANRITGTVDNITFINNTIGVAAGYSIPSDASSTDWQTAYAWGNHANADYIADADFTANGLMVRTASGVYASRTATGTDNEIIVMNGDGVDGDLIFSLPDAVYLGANGRLGRDSDNYLDFSVDNAISFVTNGAIGITLDVNGYLGIGTATPSNMLTVGMNSGSQFIVNNAGQVIAGEWLGAVIDIAHGGTGTSTPPQEGQLLIGNVAGEFEYISTSSLGIGGADTKSYFVGTTTATSNGSFATSTLTGYLAANNICATEYLGSYLCHTYDILATIELGDISAWGGDSAWVSQGSYGYGANSNDCSGWKSDAETDLGSFWSFDGTTGGEGWLTNCSVAKPLACCAWQ